MESNLINDYLIQEPDSAFLEFCLEFLPNLSEFHHFKPVDIDLDSKPKERLVVGCNCLKTKCLKLYCECFANGNRCSEDCKCKGCNNSDKFETRKKAVNSTLEKNPLAFEHSRLTGTRGCNCRRSGCKKKYCECFLNGIGCSALCRCEKCQNMVDKKAVESVRISN